MKFELVGIIGTIFILIAFMMNSEKRIRVFDMIGAVLFIVYGILLKAYSNIVLNGILVIIQIYKLCKLRTKHETE